MVEEVTTTNEVVNVAEPSVDIKSLVYNEGNVNIALNTKEHFEILNGLFLGNHVYEETTTMRLAKISKIIDLI